MSVTNLLSDLVTHGDPEEPLGWLPLETDSPEEGCPTPQVLVPEGVDPGEEPDDGEVEECVTNPGTTLVTHLEDPLDHPDMLPFREPPVPEDPEEEEGDDECVTNRGTALVTHGVHTSSRRAHMPPLSSSPLFSILGKSVKEVREDER